jgi:hypothetical protein
MINRRKALALLSATGAFPHMSAAATPLEIRWDDLIPEGVPYAEIIGDGLKDSAQDIWNPVYDENGFVVNDALDGVYIRMPGFVVPFDLSAAGVTEFMLVPYVGACLHTPPPPANQLVHVRTTDPWPCDEQWDPVWVTGTLRTQMQSTNRGETMYALTADHIEYYKW